ncbi:MAG: hypothetical protein ACJAQ3_002435 [Planctomycetota bacterium]|jgi:hypothetical protein
MKVLRLLPASSLAAVLGIRAADLREAADRGEIPFVRVGRDGRLFDRCAVERVLLARAAGDEKGLPQGTQEVTDETS